MSPLTAASGIGKSKEEEAIPISSRRKSRFHIARASPLIVKVSSLKF